MYVNRLRFSHLYLAIKNHDLDFFRNTILSHDFFEIQLKSHDFFELQLKSHDFDILILKKILTPFFIINKKRK